MTFKLCRELSFVKSKYNLQNLYSSRRFKTNYLYQGSSVQYICQAQVQLRYQLLDKLITNFSDVFDWEHGQIKVVNLSQEIT